MYEYHLTKEESRIAGYLRNMLVHDEELQQRLEDAGIMHEDLTDPGHPCYLADMIDAEGESLMKDIRKVLDGMLEQRDDEIWLTTTRTDHWDRYALEAMLRQLWRMREQEGELCFLRGDYSRNSPPMFWRVQIQREQSDMVLRCFDEDRRNYMYYLLSGSGREVDYEEFCREMREFLGFDEETVWLQEHTAFRLEGVQ